MNYDFCACATSIMAFQHERKIKSMNSCVKKIEFTVLTRSTLLNIFPLFRELRPKSAAVFTPGKFVAERIASAKLVWQKERQNNVAQLQQQILVFNFYFT